MAAKKKPGVVRAWAVEWRYSKVPLIGRTRSSLESWPGVIEKPYPVEIRPVPTPKRGKGKR